MGDRGEQRGPRLIGLGVEPREVYLRVQPCTLQRDRDLARGRLEQPHVLAADRRLALGAHHDQRPKHLAADVEREPAFLARRRVLACLDDLVRAAPRPSADLAPREVQRAEQRAGEVLQDAFEALAQQDLGGQVAEQSRLALAASRPRPLLERPRDERAHDRRDHEERDQRDRVLGVGNAQRVERLGEEVVDAQQAEDRRDQAARQTADRRGDDDAEQIDRDRPERPPRLQDRPRPVATAGASSAMPTDRTVEDLPSFPNTLTRSTLRLGYGFFTPRGTAFTRRLRTRAHALRREHPPTPRDDRSNRDQAGPGRPTPGDALVRSSIPAVEPLPPGTGHALKRVFLGPPLHTEQLEHERLGKPTALAVFASDNLSSSAYATEEMLRVLRPGGRRRRVRARRADHDRRSSSCSLS